MSYPPPTPPPPRMEDMNPIEWSAAGEPPPDAAERTDHRVYKLAVISEPRRGGKSYWRQRAEDAEGRLVDAGYRQAEDRAEIAALRSLLGDTSRRLSDELELIADESQREGWDSPVIRRVVERIRQAFEDAR